MRTAICSVHRMVNRSPCVVHVRSAPHITLRIAHPSTSRHHSRFGSHAPVHVPPPPPAPLHTLHIPSAHAPLGGMHTAPHGTWASLPR